MLDDQTAPSSPLNMRDVFQYKRWQQVIFLTYTFDLPFFESYILPMLLQNGAQSITVAVDARYLSKHLPRWLAADEINHAGRKYMVCGVHVPGAFHPKIILGATETSGSVLIGSGNLSSYGMATGGELFTLDEWREGSLSMLAQQVWSACANIGASLKVDPLFRAQLDRIAQLAPVLALDTTQQLVVHNLDEPILDQIARAINGSVVEQLVLWAPFWDRNLTALQSMIDVFRPKRVLLALQPERTNIEGTSLKHVIAQHTTIAWSTIALTNHTARSQGSPSLIHAKGILIILNSGEDVLISGSPNISTPALLKTAAEGNCEIAVLIRGERLQETLFSAAGPISFGASIDPELLTWSGDSSHGLDENAPSTITLLGATWDDRVITLNLALHDACPAHLRAVIDNQEACPVTIADGFYTQPLTGTPAPRSVRLIWDAGETNPVIISNLGELQTLSRQSGARAHTPFAALDYGGDNELIELLEQLAKFSLITVYDVDRLRKGRSSPNEHEETAEVECKVPPVDLADIDFRTMRQHPRFRAYDLSASSSSDASSVLLWLEEIVQQFNHLRADKDGRLLHPGPLDELEDAMAEPQEYVSEGRRWPVSRRIQVRVRNRICRYIQGLQDPRLWHIVLPVPMAINYSLFVQFLHRLWNRADASQTAILPPDDLARLSLELVSSFWGSDERPGYWGTLTEDQRLEAGLFFIDYHADALTIALAARLLNGSSKSTAMAPFIIAGFVRAVAPLNLLTIEAATEALTWLHQEDRDPALLIRALEQTRDHFTWSRYLDLFQRRFHLRTARLHDEGFATGISATHQRGSSSASSLIIHADQGLHMNPEALRIFVEWIQESMRHDKERTLFQMVWNDEHIVIYDSGEKELFCRSKHRRDGKNYHPMFQDISLAQLKDTTLDLTMLDR